METKGASADYARLIAGLIVADRSTPTRFRFHQATTDRRWSRLRLGTWRETLDSVPQADFQVAGRTMFQGKAGALFIRLPVSDAEPGPVIRTQVFVAEDGSMAASRSDPRSDWVASGPIGPVNSIVSEGPATAPAGTGTAPGAVAAGDASKIHKLLLDAADAEARGDFAGAAAAFEQASRFDAQAVVVAVELEKKARAIMEEGDPGDAMKLLNESDLRIKAVPSLKALSAEIANLTMRSPSYCQLGTDALKRNSLAEAFADFSSSARRVCRGYAASRRHVQKGPGRQGRRESGQGLVAARLKRATPKRMSASGQTRNGSMNSIRAVHDPQGQKLYIASTAATH